jgi:TonB family protein
MNRTFAAILMLASAFFPTVASASTPASDSAVAPIRVSTGAVAPTLVDGLNIDFTNLISSQAVPSDAQINISLTVDEKGRPHHVQVLKSFNPLLDACIVSAVEKAHYRPGTVDQQAIPMDVNLVVNVKR